MRNARGLPALDPVERDFIVSEWAQNLNDVPLEFHSEVFNRAMRNYTDSDIPFGVPQLRAAWNEIRAQTISEAAKIETASLVDEMKAIAECKHDFVLIPRLINDHEMFVGFLECGKCLISRPIFRKPQTEESTEELETACS